MPLASFKQKAVKPAHVPCQQNHVPLVNCAQLISVLITAVSKQMKSIDHNKCIYLTSKKTANFIIHLFLNWVIYTLTLGLVPDNTSYIYNNRSFVAFVIWVIISLQSL